MRLLVWLLALALAGTVCGQTPSASHLFAQAKKAEKAGRMAEAYLLYSQAAALDPNNMEYWQRSQAVRPQAELQASFPRPAASEAEAFAKAEMDKLDKPTLRDLMETRQPLPPTRLKPSPGPRDFELRGDARKLWTDVSKAFGLECVFDAALPATGRQISFSLKDVDYRTVMRGLEAATGTFAAPISEKRFLVAQDTPQKRQELEPVVSVSAPLPEAATQQDFSAMIAAVQQSMALLKVQWDSANKTVVIRDSLSKVLTAQRMFAALSRGRGEAAVEIKLLEVSRNTAITYGVDLPVQFPGLTLTNWMNNVPTLTAAAAGVLRFGGGASTFGIGILNPSLVAQMSKLTGENLLDTVIRVQNGTPASVHVGDRYPVLSSGYFGPASFSQSDSNGRVYTPPPSVNFEDLGLTAKVTPVMHDTEETSLAIEAEFKVLQGTSVDGIPIVSQRQIKTNVRLRFGEWAAIGGLLNRQEARSISGLTGLSRIPLLAPLLSRRDTQDSGAQVLLLVRPVMLSAPPSAWPGYAFHLGSESRPLTPW